MSPNILTHKHTHTFTHTCKHTHTHTHTHTHIYTHTYTGRERAGGVKCGYYYSTVHTLTGLGSTVSAATPYPFTGGQGYSLSD